MMKSKLNKILHLFFSLALISVSCQSAFAHETVMAEEVLTKQDKIDIINAQKEQDTIRPSMYSVLGEENKYGSYGNSEVHLRNWGDIIKEKRQAKAAVSEGAQQSAEGVQNKTNDLIMDCSEMEYFEDRAELEAKGKVEITTKSGAKVYSDKAIYNKDSNTIKLFDNVTLLKGGTTVNGDYMLIDLNEENALMDEPITHLGSIIINAKEGYAYSDRIENLNGNIEVNKQIEMELATRGFSRYGRAIDDARLVDFSLKKQRSKPYKFKTKQIEIRPERDHDSMIMKNVDVYYGKRKILNVPSIEMFQDKEMTYSEVNFPLEFGSLKGLGAYLGLGYTFKLPKTFTFRATPAVVYHDGDIGFGGIAQLKSKRTSTEIGWASNSNNIIFDGRYKILDKLNLDLGRHVYKDEWIAGGNRAGYIAQLDYDNSYVVNDLGGAVFRHRISGGWVADYKRKHQEKDVDSGFRYRYQAELGKGLVTFSNKEQDMYLVLGVLGQTMVTLYSEGDTFALFRVGPTISSRIKRWNSNIFYSLGGIHGKTPYYFDEYRYGRQAISFDESLILNRFLSVGYRGTLTPLKDNRERDILTENRVYAIAGPEDFKVAFSYDAVRSNIYFDFLFLLGMDNLDVKYDKLTIKDPERIGKHTQRQSDRELNKIKVPEEL